MNPLEANMGRPDAAPDPRSDEISRGMLDELAALRRGAEQGTSLLAAIVDDSDDAIISKNLAGFITSWNKSAERLFGYPAEEAIGRHITLIIPPDRHDEETGILEKLKRGERIEHFETVRARKDGTQLDVSLTISPVKDSTGRIVGASKISRDITERKRTERFLAEQARLLDLSNDAILVHDAQGRIAYWNKGASELYGYSPEEALSQVSHKLLRTLFPEPLERIGDILRRDGRWTGELIHTRKDGSQIVVASRWALDRDTHGNPGAVLETNSDITQQKMTSDALRKSEERLRALADSLETQVMARTRELEERNQEILERSQQLRELWNRLVRTQDDERRHIARELHDSVGQYLAALSMSLDAAQKNAPRSRYLDEAVQLTKSLVAETRTISHLLHPPLLEECGLAVAVDPYVQGFSARSGIRADLEIDENLPPLEKDVELALFRVLQESLTNVHRHSDSKVVAIRIGGDSQRVWLEVADQGKGSSHGFVRPGVGITGMRERVENLGGELTIDSSSRGTRVRVVIPLPTRPGARNGTQSFSAAS